ncbi:MAG: hypothetical protein ACOX8I_06855 [Bacillota bacterium]|jgi:hypothetical protein
MEIRKHGHDDRWRLFLNCGLIVLLGAFALIAAGLLPDSGTAETMPAAGITGTGAAGESTGATAGEAASKESAEAIAREFLSSIGELPEKIASAKIERYWVPANNFWGKVQQMSDQSQRQAQSQHQEQAQPGQEQDKNKEQGQNAAEDPPYRDCWVVTFYYDGLHQQAWKTVFIDITSGSVIGGADCRY